MPSIFDLVLSKRTNTKLIAKQPESNEKEILVVDATLTQTHKSTAVPTQFPVEKGGDITDHVTRSPLEYEMTGVISETPITLKQAVIGTVAGVAGNAIGQTTKNKTVGAVSSGALAALGGNLMNSGKNRVKEAYQALLFIQENSIPLKIISRLRTYDNMILTNLTIPEDAATGAALNFTCSLKEIRIVDSETVKIPRQAIDVAVRAKAESQTDKGSQPKENAKDAVEKKSSVLLKGIRGIFG